MIISVMTSSSPLSTPAPSGTTAAGAGERPQVSWQQEGVTRRAVWRSEAGWPAPRRIECVDDRMPADRALSLASEGTALLWRGDFHNARQLLQALARRLERKPRKAAASASMADAFYRHRQAQAQRARVLSMVLVELDAQRLMDLPRAPDLRAACEQAWGAPEGQPELVSLRELQGVVGAYEWRRQGVEVPALGSAPGDRIHPHYGVFSPVRGEYLDLVARAPLPAGVQTAFDVGTGTGVIAAVLARRGVPRVVATDMSERALACASDNLQHLGVADRVDVLRADLFAPGRAQLVVCNPPWLPGRAVSVLESAVYDPDSRMLRGFLSGLGEHLAPGGEGWLILSDLAEHLGLRSRQDLLDLIERAGLVVIDRLDIRPRHPKAQDAQDPLAQARRREITSLWRLAPRE